MDLSEWNQHITEADKAQREGKYDLAEMTWMLALDEAEHFGEADRRLAYTLEKVAECLWFQGRLQEALGYGMRALYVYEQALGPHHADVASIATNVAMIHHILKNYEEAERLYKRGLALKTSTLGAKHPEVIKLLGSFADLLQTMGRHEEAAQLRATENVMTKKDWMKTGTAREAVSAPEFQQQEQAPAGQMAGQPAGQPPQAAGGQSTGAAAAVARNATQPYEFGESIGLRAPGHGVAQPVARDSGSVPRPNPDQEAAARSTGIGRITQNYTGRTGEATGTTPVITGNAGNTGSVSPIGIGRTTGNVNPVTIEPQLGFLNTGQPLTQRPWEELLAHAEQAFKAGDYGQAERIWLEAIPVARGADENNPNYCFALENLAENLLRQQKFKEAEGCLIKAYQIKKLVLGDFHVALASTTSNLARLYYTICDYNNSERFSNECVTIYEKLNGVNSIEVANAVHNLATVYHVQRKYEKAEPCYERAMKLKQALLGGDHPETVRVLKSYSELLRTTHREEQARHLDECVSGLISGRWKVMKQPDQEKPESGWWKQALFSDD